MFVVNIVFPVFFIVFLGFVLMKRRLLTREFCNSATTLIFYVSLPVKLFVDVAKSDFMSLLDTKFIAFSLGITCLSFFIFWIIGALFIKDKQKLTAFVHGGYRSNFVYMGIPLIENIIGGSLPACALIVVTFVLPAYNILAVALFSHYDNTQKRSVGQQILKTLKDIIKNPMILAIAIALPFSFIGVKMPQFILVTMNYVGSISTPLALILIGTQLQLGLDRSDFSKILICNIIRGFVFPIITIAVAYYINFDYVEQITLYVMMASPTAMNSYILTKKFGGDATLAAEIIMVSIIVSAFTVPIGAYAIKLIN